MNNFFKIILLFISSIIIHSTTAQEALNFTIVDTTSYSLYQNKKWKELIKIGNKAIQHGIDYYYLRMRLGIAYYEQKKYIKAIRQFEKAGKYNSGDPVQQEYLYYSYQFSNRFLEAETFAKSFSEQLNLKIVRKPHKILRHIYTEGGYSNNPEYESLKQIPFIPFQNRFERTIFKNYAYGNICLSHFITRRLSVLHGYTYLSLSSLQQIVVAIPYTPPNQFIHKSYQNQYYIGLEYNIGKGFSIKPAATFLWLSYYATKVYYNRYGEMVVPKFKNLLYKSNEFIGSLAAEKYLSVFHIGISGSYSNLNGFQQQQASGYFTIFPFSNLNLYTTTKAIVQFDSDTLAPTKQRLIFEQIVWLRIFKIWAEASITIGGLKNTNTNNAFIIYNEPDPIKSKIGASLIIPVNEKIEFYLHYDYLNKLSKAIMMTPDGQRFSNDINYSSNLITGGIKIFL